MIRKSHYLVLSFLISLLVLFLTDCQEHPDLDLDHDQVPLRVGDTAIYLNLYKHGSRKFIYFNVHENENTSVRAIKIFIKKHGGYFVEIKSHGQRLINFELDGNHYTFDPNRIFTDVGIKKTLEKYGEYSQNAQQSIQLLAKNILRNIITDSIETVIAVHNNTNSNYSIKSYLEGGKEQINSKDVFHNPNIDPDDFFYVTNKKYFDFLKSKQRNVILQDETNLVDDGSLSVYCGNNGISYINIEAQHGHLEEQLEMLKDVLEILTTHSPVKSSAEF